MTLVAKIGLLGVAGGGGIGGAVGSVYYIKNRKDNSIKSRFSEVSNKELMNNKGDFTLAFAEYKNDQDFISLIQKTEKYWTLNSNTDSEVGGGSLYIWCFENLKIDLTDESKISILPNLEKYCTKPSKTFEERANKAGKSLVTDWNSRFSELSSSGFSSDLFYSLSSNEGRIYIVSGESLKQWCNKNIKTKIKAQRIFYDNDNLWNQLIERCYE